MTSPSEAPDPGGTCTAGWRYVVYKNISNDMKVFDRWYVTNHTGSTISATFTADTGGSVTWSASVSLSAEASAATFATVSASVNAGIEKSMTASTGVNATASVKPYSTLYGDYDRYASCYVGSTSYYEYRAPYRKGWRLYYA